MDARSEPAETSLPASPPRGMALALRHVSTGRHNQSFRCRPNNPILRPLPIQFSLYRLKRVDLTDARSTAFIVPIGSGLTRLTVDSKGVTCTQTRRAPRRDAMCEEAKLLSLDWAREEPRRRRMLT